MSLPSEGPSSKRPARRARSLQPNGSDAPEPGPSTTGRTYPRLLVAAAVVIATDQVTKSLALATLDDGPVHVVKGVVSLDLSFNSGGVFGVGRGFPGLFLAATIIVTIGILVWARRLEERSWLLPLGMVLGGGLGNLADRVFRGHDGQVVDFIDLHVWPVFNVADMAIVIGVGFVLLGALRSERTAEDEASVGAGRERVP